MTRLSLLFSSLAALWSAGCSTSANQTQCNSDSDCLNGDRCVSGQCQGNTVEGCGLDHVTCDAQATCATVGNALACACNAGYVGDGQTCNVDKTTLHVSPAGADTNDGFLMPVRTLKQAIAIAANDGSISGIELAEGRYDKLIGEQYPYTVPPGITLRGPTTGAAVLAGAGDTAGLMFGGSTLAHLELEGFTVALDAIMSSSAGTLDTVQVRSSALALQVEPSVTTTANDLTIDGTSGIQLGDHAALTAHALALHATATAAQLGAYAALTTDTLAVDASATGIQLGDHATLTAATLTVHASATGIQLGTYATLTAPTLALHDANIGADLGANASLTATTGLTIDLSVPATKQVGVQLGTSATLTATNLASTGLPTHIAVGVKAHASLTAPRLTGGGTGISVSPSAVVSVTDGVIEAATVGVEGVGAISSPQTQITLTRTTIRGTHAGFVVGEAAAHITGGEIRDNTTVGLSVDRSGETFMTAPVIIDGVRFTGNKLAGGFYGEFTTLPVTIRNSAFENNTLGIELRVGSIDLGTAASPGNNVLRSGLYAIYTAPQMYIINAVGNTWTPDTQGADADGHYASQTIIGPTSGTNFTLVKSDGDITNPNPPQWHLVL